MEGVAGDFVFGCCSPQAHWRPDGVFVGPLNCGIHIMKLHELIVELQRLAGSNPEVRFESVTYLGNGTSPTEAGFVDAKLHGDTVTIRVTVPPFRVDDVRACKPDA